MLCWHKQGMHKRLRGAVRMLWAEWALMFFFAKLQGTVVVRIWEDFWRVSFLFMGLLALCQRPGDRLSPKSMKSSHRPISR